MKALFIAIFSVATLASSAQIERIKPMITVAESTKEMPNVKLINVDAQFCRVNIVGAATTSATGKLEAIKDHDDYNVAISEQGTTASVSITVPTDAQSSYVGEITIAVAPDVEVKVNATSGNVYLTDVVAKKVTVETGKGRVTGKGGKLELDVTTKTGNVVAEGMEGKISFVTNSGSVTLNKMKGDISSDTSDGVVIIDGVEGSLNSKAVGGTQTISNISDKLSVNAGTGAVKLTYINGHLDIVAKTSPINLCDVKVAMNIETASGAINGGQGILLTGSSTFTTQSGKINLRLANSKDELTFDLASENKKASLIAKGVSKNKKLQSGSGPIVVTARTTTASQIFK